jgi:hypothetical protein
MLTPTNRAAVEQDLAAAKQCYLNSTISIVTQAARAPGVSEGQLYDQLKRTKPQRESSMNWKKLLEAQEHELSPQIGKRGGIVSGRKI